MCIITRECRCSSFSAFVLNTLCTREFESLYIDFRQLCATYIRVQCGEEGRQRERAEEKNKPRELIDPPLYVMQKRLFVCLIYLRVTFYGVVAKRLPVSGGSVNAAYTPR